MIGQASASVLKSSLLKRRESGIAHSPNQDFALWQVVAGYGLPIGEILSAVAFERRRAIFARDGSD
jgi:hypothetical protein